MNLRNDLRKCEDIERKLDEADRVAEASPVRYSADEVFTRVKKKIGDTENS